VLNPKRDGGRRPWAEELVRAAMMVPLPTPEGPQIITGRGGGDAVIVQVKEMIYKMEVLQKITKPKAN
jgi:hypothetical protein